MLHIEGRESEVKHKEARSSQRKSSHISPVSIEQGAKPVSNAKQQIPFLLSNIETLFKHNELELGFHLILKCLSEDSKHPGVLKKLAFYFEKKGQLDKAVKVYNELIKSDYSFESLSSLARLEYLRGRDDAAFAKYQEALTLVTAQTTDLFEIYKNLGNIVVKQSDFDAAEEFYCKAFTIDENSDTLQVNLGTLALQKGDLQQALDRFRSALNINSTNDKAWVGLAIAHQSMGDHELAFANLENALDANSKNKTAVQLISQWAVKEYRYESACVRLQTYMAEAEFDEEISLLLIHLLCLTQQFDKALLEIERCLLWNPKNVKVAGLEKEIRKMRIQGKAA